ncbi:MAG: PAS domain S-box protein [Candidatus Melainabacteria bacterium]|nr:PAS domain S-box protein [Candidatus Melainabacteria bacterium]
MRVLIVEDSPTLLDSISRSLSERGLMVEPASNLEQASEILNGVRVDVILLDLMLADSSGLDTFYAIRSLAPDVPIVTLTGISEQDLALQAVESGSDGYLLRGVASNEAVFRRLQFAMEHHAIERALRRSEKRLRIILENSYDAFISVDAQWRITDWNKQAEKTFGWKKEDVLGKALATIVPKHFRRQYARRIEGNFEEEGKNLLRATYELAAVHRDGTEFPIEIGIFKIREDDDYLYCAFVKDISESKRLNEDLERLVEDRTEKLTTSNEELRQFAKVASHDLQEPLRAVQGFANLLAENTRGKLDRDSEEFIEYILDGTRRMQELIQAVLTHSHISSEGSEGHSTNCNAVVVDVLANLRLAISESGASFEIGDLPEVAVERSQLVQLFQNLISNALKYRSDKKPQIFIDADRSGDMWLFSVRDNGIGMDPRYSDRIFDMFARLHGKTQYSGTGMGLAICKRIVTSHGGTISVESELGEGSIFLFSLPAVREGVER